MRRKEMKSRIIPFAGVIVLAISMVAGVSAQDDSTVTSAAGDLYVISAKAGGINYVEGSAVANRADGKAGRLIKGDQLDAGDVVETGADSRVEILLNPGSFARLDRNTRFELTTTDLDELRLKVLSGSAIFEVFASDDFSVTVNTPLSEFYLIKSGVYRVDVRADGVARLEVWRGKAETADDADGTLKKGRTAMLDGGEVEIAKFDRDDKDEFERWSKDRAELIAKANKKLTTKRLEPSLLSGFRSDAWDCYQSIGLWVYSTRYGTYSFLPFGYGWRSPYGIGLRTSTGICFDPSYYYGRPYPRYYGGRRPVGGGGGNSGGGTPPSNQIPAANIDRGRRATTPPFRRMQQSGGIDVRRTPSAPSSRGIFPPLGSSGGRSGFPSSSSPASKSEPTSKGKDN
ncbi:MAG: FecR domain-containing protein [Acidobacteriota bacterium]|nr:MAG: FecR domain-containing protein [Acidobacteriota bacterium]